MRLDTSLFISHCFNLLRLLLFFSQTLFAKLFKDNIIYKIQNTNSVWSRPSIIFLFLQEQTPFCRSFFFPPCTYGVQEGPSVIV